MRVLIDTNIYLAFYEFSQDDLKKLSEAFDLAGQHEFSFLSTKQIKDEFERRRSSVISKSLDKLRDLKVPGIPTMLQGINEANNFIESRKSLAETHKNFVDAAYKKVTEKALAADVLISKILENSTNIDLHSEIIERAKFRVECGNPPGKKGSLGDAINWEALLSIDDDKNDVVIVTQDRDYIDPLDKSALNSFLRLERQENHPSEIRLFQTLGEFISNLFPKANVEIFQEVDKKISALAGSTSFANTHAAIAELSSVDYFTKKQAATLVHILNQNDQVKWILDDKDVRDFYTKLQKDCEQKLDYFEADFLQEMLDFDGTGELPIFIPF